MFVSPDDLEMTSRLLAGLLAGALIGYERSYHGRPAGFRTHALVCMASSLLMLVTVYEAHWVQAVSDSVRLDPTRMAQGIMTGIGFLGAGVIVKISDKIEVHGLKTAASIWLTAGVGIAVGLGHFWLSAAATLVGWLVLGPLKHFERRHVAPPKG